MYIHMRLNVCVYWSIYSRACVHVYFVCVPVCIEILLVIMIISYIYADVFIASVTLRLDYSLSSSHM